MSTLLLATWLFARNGQWQGKQVIRADWVTRSSNSWIPVYSDEPNGMGYGYQWWVYRHKTASGPKMHGGWGWGGQFPLIVPELDLIAVFTGWNIREDGHYAYAFDLSYDRVVASIAYP